MILAERRRSVPVETKRFSQGCDGVWSDACVARKRCRDLGDTAHIVHMVVAARQQRSARGRTKGRSVKLIVAKPFVGQPLQGRHVDWAAERARLAESHVVEQHDQHVGRVGWSFDLEASRRNDVARIQHIDRRRFRLGYRQDGAVHRRRSGSAAGGRRLCPSGAAEPGTAQHGRQRRLRGGQEQVASLHRFPPIGRLRSRAMPSLTARRQLKHSCDATLRRTRYAYPRPGPRTSGRGCAVC